MMRWTIFLWNKLCKYAQCALFRVATKDGNLAIIRKLIEEYTFDATPKPVSHRIFSSINHSTALW